MQPEGILKQQKDIKNILLAKMNKIEHDYSTELIKKYPLGYCLFAINHKQVIIPYKSNLESDYELNWNSARIATISPEVIEIKLPGIRGKHNENEITGFASNLSRQVGSIDPAIIIGHMKIATELIADDEQGIIVVIGFSNS